MAGRARRRPGCSSAMPARGGSRSAAIARVASASPELLPNAETWLDFTDLVFIDPVGTGYSRFVAQGRGGAQALLLGRRRRQFDRAGDPALAGKERSAAVAEIRRRRELWRHPRAEDRAQSADPAGRRREGADPGLAVVRFPRLPGHQPDPICREPALDGRRRARSQGRRKGCGDAKRPCRRRALCARRVSRRPRQGPGRHRSDHAARRQGRSPDRDRSGGEPQARRALRHRRIPQGVRPPQRQGHRPLRCFRRRLRSLSRFKLPSFRRSLGRSPDGATDKCRGRSDHAQIELAAGRVLRAAQRFGGQVLGFRPRPQPDRVRSRSSGRSSRSIQT